MELRTITIKFDSVEEQKFVEENIYYLTVYSSDTETLLTDFDISGCEPHDVQEALDEIMERMAEEGIE